ncbi:MAG: KTSC domain-containing protein [bacterium]|nr:KTSC domain-containing protein [bacterium]
MSSRNLVSVGYDADSATLEIKFGGGRVYQYADVPQEAYRALMNADSIGSHFHHHIRDKYPTTEVL